MGAVFGRALVAPEGTSQQEPAVGNWSCLSTSGGDAGAAHWWPGRDSTWRRTLCGEDRLRLGQVGCSSVNTQLLLPLPASGTTPLPLSNVGARVSVVLISSGLALSAAALKSHQELAAPVILFLLLHSAVCDEVFLSCAALVCPQVHSPFPGRRVLVSWNLSEHLRGDKTQERGCWVIPAACGCGMT